MATLGKHWTFHRRLEKLHHPLKIHAPCLQQMQQYFGAAMKILAVDDNLLTLDLLGTLAAQLGFRDLNTASSGHEAFQILRSEGEIYDCLLFDISMAGMDGIELCSLVRALPAYQMTPIIMLTSMVEKDYVDRAFKAGATDYATKPFHIAELGARLRMAQELIAARRSKALARTAAAKPVSSHSFGLADDIAIDGFAGLIRYTALGNYLLQLSKARLAGTQVLAVKIDQIETIYAQATSAEFVYAISEVADALCGRLCAVQPMMAYAGNGVFLIVLSGTVNVSPDVLELDVQNLLDERNSEHDNGTPLDLDVSFGNPIVPHINSTLPAWSIFDRAIARAESRSAQKQNQSPKTLLQVL